jgi:hypothetical protein
MQMTGQVECKMGGQVGAIIQADKASYHVDEKPPLPGHFRSNTMTMAHERTRSVVQTRDFLQELARDTSLPENVRYQANNLLRHYPTAEAVWLAGRVEERSKQELSLLADKHGPLHPVLVSWLLNDPMFSDNGTS